MQVIAVLNQKGGSGKTTIATHLARALQLDGASVLLVDSDPQGSARDWAAVQEDNPVTVVGIDRPTIDRDLKAIGHKDFVVIDGAPQAADLAQQFQVFDRPQVSRQCGMSGQEANHAPHPRRVHPASMAEDLRLPRRRRLQPQQQPQRRRLAGAVGPQQSVNRPGRHLQAHIVDGNHFAAVDLRQMLGANGQRH